MKSEIIKKLLSDKDIFEKVKDVLAREFGYKYFNELGDVLLGRVDDAGKAVIAGGSVASAVFEVLGLPYKTAFNDLDVFVPSALTKFTEGEQILPLSKHNTANSSEARMRGTGSFSGNCFWAIEMRGYEVHSTTMLGKVNIVGYRVENPTSHSTSQTRLVVDGFDISSVGVGFSLYGKGLYFTEAFVEFLQRGILAVNTFATPAHSIVRLYEKSEYMGLPVCERAVQALLDSIHMRTSHYRGMQFSEYYMKRYDAVKHLLPSCLSMERYEYTMEELEQIDNVREEIVLHRPALSDAYTPSALAKALRARPNVHWFAKLELIKMSLCAEMEKAIIQRLGVLSDVVLTRYSSAPKLLLEASPRHMHNFSTGGVTRWWNDASIQLSDISAEQFVEALKCIRYMRKIWSADSSITCSTLEAWTGGESLDSIILKPRRLANYYKEWCEYKRSALCAKYVNWMQQQTAVMGDCHPYLEFVPYTLEEFESLDRFDWLGFVNRQQGIPHKHRSEPLYFKARDKNKGGDSFWVTIYSYAGTDGKICYTVKLEVDDASPKYTYMERMVREKGLSDIAEMVFNDIKHSGVLRDVGRVYREPVLECGFDSDIPF